jgi:hypothetical protein
MQQGATAWVGRARDGVAALVPVVCLLLGPALAQGTAPGQLPAPPRLSAADLPDLTLASSDGLRIGRAALPGAAPPLPPARTAARVPVPPLAPAAPQVAVLGPVDPAGPVLAPIAPAALPQTTWLSLAVLAPVTPAAAARAEPPRPLPVALPGPAPRGTARAAAAVPADRLAPVAPGPLASRWPDPEDPADRAVLEGIFGAALPPGLMLEPPAPADPKALALAVQTELQRLNCYRGALDGDFGSGSRRAVEAYGTAAGSMPDTLDPTPALLRTLQALPDGKLCPDPARPKPAAPAAAGTAAPKQQAKPQTPRQQPAAPAPKPAKKQPDIAIIGL